MRARLGTITLFVMVSHLGNAQVSVTTANPNIPPGVFGGYAVPANFSTVFLERNQQTSSVYFAVNGTIPGTDIHPGQVYFNERTCMGTPCNALWKYPVSKPVLTFTGMSVSVADVLYDPSRPFYNMWTNQYYFYLMYVVIQPVGCDGQVAGYLALSFSNDGETWWVDPTNSFERMLAYRYGGPAAPCLGAVGLSSTVPVEAFGAIFNRGNGTIIGVGVEGDILLLRDGSNFSRTQTYVATSSPLNPRCFSILGELSAIGISQGIAPACTPHNYFINLSTAFEPATGKFWITRAYPYAYDAAEGTAIPCEPSCGGGVYLRPNRVEVFTMTIGSLANVASLLTGEWQLVCDLGAPTGYASPVGGCIWGSGCAPTPIYGSQQSIGMMTESINFRRKGDGALAYTPTLGASNVEFEISGTSNYDYTCSTWAGLFDTQSRQALTPIGHGPKYQGYFDSATCATRLLGWVWDANDPASTIGVDVFVGGVLRGSYPAGVYRADLQMAGIGDGRHGFDVQFPGIDDGQNHVVRVVVSGTAVDLALSPKTLFCPVP